MASAGSSDPVLVVARLLAIQLAEGKSIAKAAALLHRAGLDNQEIARICGTTAKAISVRLAEAKRRK